MDRQQNDSRDLPGQRPGVQFITIETDDAGQRVDNYLVRELKGVPKTRVYRIIRKGEVRVNKKRVQAAYRLQSGDLLRIPPVRVAEKNAVRLPGNGIAEKLESAILYEDSKLIILNKPSGIAVHGGSGITFGVIEALRKIRSDERTLELVHRLDRDTSGCLMIAKKRSMLRYLHNQFQEDRISKIYNALVVGRWPSRKLLVNAPLQKNTLQSGERMVRVDLEGKRSKTRYRVLERYSHQQGQATLVEASPITGRTHQIRVHCLHAGYPILGDDKYGDDEGNRRYKQLGLKRLFLHASSLELVMPEGQSLKIEAPLPEDLQELLAGLSAG
ncbi:MAG: 23S rRNA pseudouridine(955/2504/2580) synthase RluC [Endozoicomonas sp.]